MFSPNLILGVSDEVPPTADIEKVKFVSKIVENFKPWWIRIGFLERLNCY